MIALFTILYHEHVAYKAKFSNIFVNLTWSIILNLAHYIFRIFMSLLKLMLKSGYNRPNSLNKLSGAPLGGGGYYSRWILAYKKHKG